MDELYLKLLPLENDLRSDEYAMTWFDVATTSSVITSTPPPSEIPFTTLLGTKLESFEFFI